jgi:uncharacterized NAD-dependent epimerase/dehydratase family protein
MLEQLIYMRDQGVTPQQMVDAVKVEGENEKIKADFLKLKDNLEEAITLGIERPTGSIEFADDPDIQKSVQEYNKLYNEMKEQYEDKNDYINTIVATGTELFDFTNEQLETITNIFMLQPNFDTLMTRLIRENPLILNGETITDYPSSIDL